MMAPDRQALARLRSLARHARAEGHFVQAARLEQQAVELASALGLIGERTRALLWQGYSLRQTGQDDLALAVLLSAANERAAAADPADVFAALTAVIHVSLDRKSPTFCRALLDQGRRYLADLRQPWTALLDYLDGELAYRQADFAAAWDWHSRAWADWRDQHPRLTAATHLWSLCRVAFRRRDAAALERLTTQLNALDMTQALERQLAQRARLLLWRARRVTEIAGGTAAEVAPVETASALLAGAATGDCRGTGAREEALRVLALVGCWAEIDAALLPQPLTDHSGSERLRASLLSNRARSARGLAAIDDEF